MENKDLTNINDVAYQKLIDNITTLWGDAKSKAIVAVSVKQVATFFDSFLRKNFKC